MSDGQEKTEEPTGKRITDARRRGQVPRSREAGTFLVLLSGVLGLWLCSSLLGTHMSQVMEQSFSLSREQAFTVDEMGRLFFNNVTEVGPTLLLVILIVLIFAIAGAFFLGGYNFSTEAISPKLTRFNPINGLKRIFSLNSVVELIKSIAKVGCIGTVCYLLLSHSYSDILRLSYLNPEVGTREALSFIFYFMLIIVMGMIPIILLDVPFQIWHYRKQLRMSKQEVKDELKDTEGNPQIKSRIRRLQYEMAARRMMAKVPAADVVVTNPTHYAVALKYEVDGDRAPVVVARGIDMVAQNIIRIARETNVPVLPLPPLARSLYYTTDLDQEIPRGLFQAVAQVLAWVLSMKAYKEGKADRPRDLNPDLPIPEELRF